VTSNRKTIFRKLIGELKMRRILLVANLVLLPFLLLPMAGCATQDAMAKEPLTGLPLSVDVPKTQALLDIVPVPRYSFAALDKNGKRVVKEFEWPLYVTIGEIYNKTGTYETAAAGQVNYSTVLGLEPGDYYENTANRTKALRVLYRGTSSNSNPTETAKIIAEVSGEGGRILEKLTMLDPNMVREHVIRRTWPSEYLIGGAIIEVTIAERSAAAGLSFAGIGGSGKFVETNIYASIKLINIYTGEELICKIGQNKVKSFQLGINVFKIVSLLGADDKYLNLEVAASKEMDKGQVQRELVDFLYYVAMEELYKERPEFVEDRLHYRVGIVSAYAEQFAKQQGLTFLGEVRPVPMKFKAAAKLAEAAAKGTSGKAATQQLKEPQQKDSKKKVKNAKGNKHSGGLITDPLNPKKDIERLEKKLAKGTSADK
jgi:hypothetical protein